MIPVGLARCEDCGFQDEVKSFLAPTPEIVRQVCERDPCPACGGRMKPVRDAEEDS